MSRPAGSLVQDAAAPLLLLGAIAASGLAALDIWTAAGLAALAGTGTWSVPELRLGLPIALAADGVDAVTTTGASRLAFGCSLSAMIAVQLVAGGVLAVRIQNRNRSSEVRRRSLLRRHDLGELTGRAAAAKARQLRPSLPRDGDLPNAQQGLRLLRVAGCDVRMSWEDVALIIMGPRSNKTSALAVPAVLSAPGLTVATSNKADLWTLTSQLREQAGPVWTFDPQEIAYAPQAWWWDPLRAIRDAPDAARFEAASRLAGHFMGTIGGARRDPFFHAAGEQVLVGTLLAAAMSGGSLREVLHWLQHGRRDAIVALDDAGADAEAADLEASLGGADVTTKGIFQTARTATKALASERILRWITPPVTWRESPPPGPVPELDPWQVLARTAQGPGTMYLLSKEGAGTAAPVVAALVDRLLEVAELFAQARGGRLDPPAVAVLDEAANICPIQQLPQLYSHYGSRGIQLITMLQSYRQGVGVWGEQGMDALWSTATVKLVGAGVDDHAFLQRLSGLIGDHDVAKVSVSHSRHGGPARQYSTARQPILPPSALRALPKDKAVLLTTGRRAGLGDLQPWYRERDAAHITTYAAAALAEIRRAAADALGPGNPVAPHLVVGGDRVHE